MAMFDDEKTTEPIGAAMAAGSAAHERTGELPERGQQRSRSSSKTPKSARTRERIMAAATRLIIERRSVLFQMGEVSELCGMSKGALYYYFTDRDELIAAVFDDAVDDLVATIEDVMSRAESSRDSIRGLYCEFTRLLHEGSVLAFALAHELAGGGDFCGADVTSRLSRVTGLIATQFEQAKAEGVVRQDIDSDMAATYTIGGLYAMAMAIAYGSDNNIDVDMLVQRLMDMTFSGVGVPGTLLDA